MKKLSIVMAAILMTGCATTRPEWRNDAVDQAQFEKDKSQCLYEARVHTQPVNAGIMSGYQSDIGAAIAEASRLNELAIMCMKARGYTLVQVDKKTGQVR